MITSLNFGRLYRRTKSFVERKEKIRDVSLHCLSGLRGSVEFRSVEESNTEVLVVLNPV